MVRIFDTHILLEPKPGGFRTHRTKIELQVQGLPQQDELKKGFVEAKKILKGFASLSPSGVKDVRCNLFGIGSITCMCY